MSINSQNLKSKSVYYAGGRMDFTRGNFKPRSAGSILQAFYYRSYLLHLSNPSKLVISKKWKSRIALLVHNALGLCSDGYRQNPARLALPDMRPTLFEKSRGEFLNQIKGGPEPLENEINKIIGSKREDRFSDHFFPIWYKISVRFVFRTFFASAFSVTPVAGLIFKTKNRAIFLERFFGREITAREQLSRAVILARF